jgi:hypothetical protein
LVSDIKEHGLRVFENRVLRGIIGLKTGEVTGEWRKLHKEEFHDLYSLPSIIRTMKLRKMRWVGNVARMGGEEERLLVVGGKARGKEATRKTNM